MERLDHIRILPYICLLLEDAIPGLEIRGVDVLQPPPAHLLADNQSQVLPGQDDQSQGLVTGSDQSQVLTDGDGQSQAPAADQSQSHADSHSKAAVDDRSKPSSTAS